jgi:hypothetical protein
VRRALKRGGYKKCTKTASFANVRFRNTAVGRLEKIIDDLSSQTQPFVALVSIGRKEGPAWDLRQRLEKNRRELGISVKLLNARDQTPTC